MPPNPTVNPFLLPVPLPIPAGPPANSALFRPAFLTNNRGFSLSDTQDDHHFKMHAEVSVAFDGTPRILDRAALGGKSIQIEPVTGAVVQEAVSDSSRMHITQLPSVPSPNQFIPASPRSIAIKFNLATSIPLIPGSTLAGDIDTTGTLVIDAGFRTVSFDGFLDAFPAFEAFVSVDVGATRSLFQILPDKGSTPLDLPGPANRPVNAFSLL